MKSIEGETNKWKVILGLWIGASNIVKMSILTKMTYTSNTIPIKIPIAEKRINPKICMEPQKIWNNQSNLEKEEPNRKHHTP
jgi:hypothetical protein